MAINWNNVASWGRTIGQVGAALSGAALTYNISNPNITKIAFGCSIVAAVIGEVVKQFTNPKTFPQTPISEAPK